MFAFRAVDERSHPALRGVRLLGKIFQRQAGALLDQRGGCLVSVEVAVAVEMIMDRVMPTKRMVWDGDCREEVEGGMMLLRAMMVMMVLRREDSEDC